MRADASRVRTPTQDFVSGRERGTDGPRSPDRRAAAGRAGAADQTRTQRRTRRFDHEFRCQPGFVRTRVAAPALPAAARRSGGHAALNLALRPETQSRVGSTVAPAVLREG